MNNYYTNISNLPLQSQTMYLKQIFLCKIGSSFPCLLKNNTHILKAYTLTITIHREFTQPRANLLGNRTSSSVNEKNPCWGHRLWCRLLIPTSAPQDCWLSPTGRAGTEQQAIHEQCAQSDWDTQIQIFLSQTQEHIQHCQFAGRHQWLCPQQANGATQHSHFLMHKSKKH